MHDRLFARLSLGKIESRRRWNIIRTRQKKVILRCARRPGKDVVLGSTPAILQPGHVWNALRDSVELIVVNNK